MKTLLMSLAIGVLFLGLSGNGWAEATGTLQCLTFGTNHHRVYHEGEVQNVPLNADKQTRDNHCDNAHPSCNSNCSGVFL